MKWIINWRYQDGAAMFGICHMSLTLLWSLLNVVLAYYGSNILVYDQQSLIEFGNVILNSEYAGSDASCLYFPPFLSIHDYLCRRPLAVPLRNCHVVESTAVLQSDWELQTASWSSGCLAHPGCEAPLHRIPLLNVCSPFNKTFIIHSYCTSQN